MASPDLALVQGAAEVAVERFARRILLDGLDPTHIRFRLDLVGTYRPPPVEVPVEANILGLELVRQFVLSSLTRKHDPSQLPRRRMRARPHRQCRVSNRPRMDQQQPTVDLLIT